MGALFQRLLQPYFREVLISDLETGVAKQELIDWCEVILVSVPIRQTQGVLREIVPSMREEQLLLDLTSLKELPCQEMLQGKSAVIGLHPLFSPKVEHVKGLSLIFCPVRPHSWGKWLREILEKEGMHVSEMTPQAHDEKMAIIQALTHFTSLIFSETLRKEGSSTKELLTMASPVFRMQMEIIRRVLSQSSMLYADIEIDNPYFPELLELFEKSFKELKEIVLQKDRAAFEAFFERNTQSGE